MSKENCTNLDCPFLIRFDVVDNEGQKVGERRQCVYGGDTCFMEEKEREEFSEKDTTQV